MSVFKCKMCGGSLNVVEGMKVIECEYCGTQQTLPRLDDERRLQLYNRASHFRQQCAFDKASQIYETIVSETPDDAEAHWSLVLCRYGIEYVEDPNTLERVPTCHRANYASVFDDVDYLQAIENADSLALDLYKREAVKIDKIQKGILEISNKEEPFDVFICYKETDNNGNRTLDSVKAQEIYDALVREEYKVFFSRITLEDKLGQSYEPYIFAALNSARVMLVIGSQPEYVNSVWVKNEWSRYLKMMTTDKDKTLIPCYFNMDPYDLPDEFSHLQGQDMTKIGFKQDLIRGINKLTGRDMIKNASHRDKSLQDETDALLKRVFNFLEDGNFSAADQYCERILDRAPENAYAYLGKLLAEYKVKKKEDLKNCSKPFDGSINYRNIVKYGDKELVGELNSYIEHINDRNHRQKTEDIYNKAVNLCESPNATVEDVEKARELFATIPDYKFSRTYIDTHCSQRINAIRYNQAKNKYQEAKKENSQELYEEAKKLFQFVMGYSDARKLSEECDRAIAEIQEKEHQLGEKLEKEYKVARVLRFIVGILFIGVIVLGAIWFNSLVVEGLRPHDSVKIDVIKAIGKGYLTTPLIVLGGVYIICGFLAGFFIGLYVNDVRFKRSFIMSLAISYIVIPMYFIWYLISFEGISAGFGGINFLFVIGAVIVLSAVMLLMKALGWYLGVALINKV